MRMIAAEDFLNYRSRIMRSRRIVAHCVLLAAMTVACGASTAAEPVPPASAWAGTYSMVAINGQALPFTLVEYPQGGRSEVATGTMTLNPDLTFAEAVGVRLVVTNVSNTNTHRQSGKITVDGASVRFTPSSGGSGAFTGAIRGDTLTYTLTGTTTMTVTWLKQ
jgi:hypothetical protein